MRVSSLHSWIVLAAPIAMLGCGSSENESSVTGTVTYNGQPLSGGQGRVLFQKVSDPGKVYIGRIGQSGAYEIKETASRGGAESGDYNVSIEYADLSGGAPKSLIPDRYGSTETSGFTETISFGANDIDFDLTDE